MSEFVSSGVSDRVVKRSKLFMRFLKYDAGLYKPICEMLKWSSEECPSVLHSLKGWPVQAILQELSTKRNKYSSGPEVHTIDIMDKVLAMYRNLKGFSLYPHDKADLPLGFKDMEKLYNAILEFDKEHAIK